MDVLLAFWVLGMIVGYQVDGEVLRAMRAKEPNKLFVKGRIQPFNLQADRRLPEAMAPSSLTRGKSLEAFSMKQEDGIPDSVVEVSGINWEISHITPL